MTRLLGTGSSCCAGRQNMRVLPGNLAAELPAAHHEKAWRLLGNPAGFSPLNTKLGPKNERQGMLDADKHLMAAEYLTGTFYPTEDSPPAAMSHDQATALATAHALLGIAGLLREISAALTSRS
jgi:hypothetical protein